MVHHIHTQPHWVRDSAPYKVTSIASKILYVKQDPPAILSTLGKNTLCCVTWFENKTSNQDSLKNRGRESHKKL